MVLLPLHSVGGGPELVAVLVVAVGTWLGWSSLRWLSSRLSARGDDFE